jgi:penicillin-binding protein 2
MKIIEKHGGKFLSTFAIRKMNDGTYDFYWVGIDKVENKKAYDARVLSWKKDNCKSSNVKSTMTPAELFAGCRKEYGIPDDMSYEDAYKILSVWQEVRSVYFASYMPVTIAENVDFDTVAEIEIRSNELTGMQINQSNTRVYPNKSMAAHIIGYMGRMVNEDTINDMVKLGYSREDLVGVSGIENTQEIELSGNTTERTGTKVVEVDSLGKVVREISGNNKTPTAGNDVILTLDSGLQKVTEEALADNIAQIKAKQEARFEDPKYKDKYISALSDRKVKKINYASVGAAVVMDVQTGNVLAMASYPTYDLNLFSGGFLSNADYKKYFLDEGTNNPLFNNAISSKGTPGSVFKMCTGLAGLMEGVITVKTQITDEGYYNTYVTNPNEKGPSCWVRPRFSDHSNQTIVEGLEHSCNYFFFKVADDLKIDKLNKWADLLGLTTKTNIELPNEAAGQVGNQSTLYSKNNMSGVAALVRNKIAGYLKTECVKLNFKYDDSTYTSVALDLMNLVNSSSKNKGPDIGAILKNELKLSSSEVTTSGLVSQISQAIYEITWNPNFTIEAGIGQSVTLLTPIGMARYVSALVNGGNVFEARLVKSIMTPDGTIRSNPPKLIRNLGVDPVYLEKIKEGMHKVVSDEEAGGGTAADYFKDYKYKSEIGGKTGTAQVSQTIDLENNSWFVAFAPYDKPEIAVVVYIPHGYQGLLSGYTAKQVIQYYLDKKNQVNTPVNLPQVDTLVK